MVEVLLPFVLGGCFLLPEPEGPDDPPVVLGNLPPGGGQTPPPAGDTPYVGGFLQGEFCDVQAVFQVSCVVGCHSGLVPGGGLDLDTDPYYATVGRVGAGGRVLVEPGYPEQSFLYRKMLGDLQPDEGAVMPTSGVLDAPFTDVIRRWIADGAYNDCQPGTAPPEPTDYTEDEPYHPPGWSDGGVHGVANNLQTGGDCRQCHGDQLDGGTSGVTCDDCHEPGWRTDCTFCHGGVDNLTGAPPEDIDNSPVSQAFPSHTAHVTGYTHLAYGCEQCHVQRYDVLTPGHIFDDLTAGYGELNYTQGLSPYGTYLFGTCDNLYCHGGGLLDDGYATIGDTMYCYSCHPDGLSSGAAEWAQMSGRHALHMEEAAAQCYECHSQVTDAAQNLIGPQYHVNGLREVQPVGVVYDGNSCNGACHGFNHNNSGW